MIPQILVALAIAAFGNASAAHAQSATDEERRAASSAHFDRGVEFVQDGDLRAALIEFKRAYAAMPDYRVLYNLAQVSNELREYTAAEDYYRRYLTEGGNEIAAMRRLEVTAELSKLSGRIAKLSLATNLPGAQLFVDGVAVGTAPLNTPVRVSAGERVIAATASGRPRVTRTVEVAGGESLVVHVDFPADEAREVAAPADVPAPKTTADSGPSPALWVGIGAGALGVAAGIMAYLAAQDAADYHDALDRKTTARELDMLDDRATSKALVTDILLGATLAATAATIIVAVTSSSERERPPPPQERVSARLRLGVGSLGVTGGF